MFRSLDIWLPAYLRRHRPPVADGITDIMLCICDHFEPFHGTDRANAIRRVKTWTSEYPRLFSEFRDADEVSPQHTFFFPVEQYDAEVVEELAGLCREGYGEVEIHLHHDNDTPDGLREKLEKGKTNLASHGLLARDSEDRIRYGFVHGNWALDNSDPTGRNCGVNNELDILLETGCYADFTMPSAPHPAQTRMVNSIYYAKDTPEPKSHDTGTPARVHPPSAAAHSLQPAPRSSVGAGERALRSSSPGAGGPALRLVTPEHPPGGGSSSSGAGGPALRSSSSGAGGSSALLMVQGPLALNWRNRKYGVLPRIENAEISGVNPPTATRTALWLRQRIGVVGRPEWIFIKLHTHGCDEQRGNMQTVLGETMRLFHKHLHECYNVDHEYRLHYVTAREAANIIHAAETGHTGNPDKCRNHSYHSRTSFEIQKNRT